MTNDDSRCGCGQHCSCGCNEQQHATQDCTCHDLHHDMYALLDKELTAEDCARLERHLRQCPDCAALVEAESTLRKLLKKCCCGQAPDSLRQKITYSLRVETTYYSS